MLLPLPRGGGPVTRAQYNLKLAFDAWFASEGETLIEDRAAPELAARAFAAGFAAGGETACNAFADALSLDHARRMAEASTGDGSLPEDGR